MVNSGDDATDFLPLQVPPDHGRRDRVAKLAGAILITLVSGVVLLVSEMLLRDGYNRFTWGIVWFASLGVLAIAIVGWCMAAAKPLRRRVRRWRRYR
jgi:hypothetical protein